MASQNYDDDYIYVVGKSHDSIFSPLFLQTDVC